MLAGTELLALNDLSAEVAERKDAVFPLRDLSFDGGGSANPEMQSPRDRGDTRLPGLILPDSR